MKKIYILLFFFATVSAYSQDLSLIGVGSDTTIVTSETSYAYMFFRNNTASSIPVRITRTANTVPANWETSMCYGYCYAPFVNTIPDPGTEAGVMLLPGQRDTMDLTMSTPSNGTAYVTLRVFNDNNPSVFAEKTFTIIRTNVGIHNISTIVKDFSLSQNYPNPFNPTTNIKFSIPKSGIVTLKVYNSLGKEVAALINGQQMPAGEYIADMNADALRLSSGMYFYTLNAGEKTDTKKMILIK